jgi:hypothetical protein
MGLQWRTRWQVVKTPTIISNNSVFMCFYGYQNKQRLLPRTALRDWILWPTGNVFTARYELIL